jgi:hypothetical protein
MNTLFILALVIFFGYVGIIWKIYGVQPSISDSYYVLPKKYNFLFTFFCWGFAIPTIIFSETAIMFVAGSSISFVGAAAAFKDTLTRKVHYTGAYLGVALSQLSIAVDFKLYILNIIFLVSTILLFSFKKTIKNHIWWIEIISFLLVFVALFIYKIL